MGCRNLFGHATLCWCCQNAVADEHGSCRWSRVLLPVEGWETTKGVSAPDHIVVKKCPEFIPDTCVTKAAQDCVNDSKMYLTYEMLMLNLLNKMRLLDYDPMYKESYEEILEPFSSELMKVNLHGFYEVA